ncbi:MAG: hypothetical protein K1X74_06220 [Pirellulales bacterium]|nr:hypothetical protein [Pirellulales bacterium]
MGSKTTSLATAMNNVRAELEASVQPRVVEQSQSIPTNPGLDALRKQILQALLRSAKSQADSLRHAIAAGAGLLQARQHVSPGLWLDWIQGNFSAQTGLTERTAQTYMALAKRQDELVRYADTKRASHRGRKLLHNLSIRAAVGVLRQLDRDQQPLPKKRRAARQESSFACAAQKSRFADNLAIGQPLPGQRRVLLQAALNSVEDTIDVAVVGRDKGDLDCAVLIVPLDPLAAWFAKLADYPLALLNKPVRFPWRAADPGRMAPPRPALLVLLGEARDEGPFAQLCRPHGHVYVPLRLCLNQEESHVAQ